MSATPTQIFKRVMEAIFKDKLSDSVRRMFVLKTIRPGRLVGKDQYGNAYYQAPKGSMEQRERWVEFAGKKSDINAHRIPPEWHTWMTKIQNEPPTAIPFEQPSYLLRFRPNELSKMAEHANFVPSNYYNRPVDVQPVLYPKTSYSAWNPSTKASTV